MRRVAEVVERQFGAIARWQLLEAGITDTQISWLLRNGRMFRIWPGVYAWGRRDLPSAGRLVAALLYAGRGAGLTGLSNLWWRGLLHREPDAIHIDAPGFSRSRPGLVIRHPPGIRRAVHEGVPVVPLPRALLVASTDLNQDSLRLVLGRAEYDRKLGFTLAGLEADLRTRPAGCRALRAAMASHLPQLARCANGFERDFVLLCERFDLPIPEPNVRKGRFVPDMTWEDRKLIVELDGEDAHRTPAQRMKDAKRQEWLETRGYAVIRFTWAQVQFRQDGVSAELRRHLS